MTDERYTFVEQQRERKAAARGAKHRVCGSKSKRCTLPHEYLTPAQMKRRNSPVITCTMNKPHTKAELMQWSEGAQRLYLQSLRDTYCPTYPQLAGMLGCSQSTVYNVYRRLNIPLTNQRQTAVQHDLWNGFIAGESPEHAVSNVSSDNVRVPPEPESPVDAATEPHTASGFPFDSISLTLTGKPAVVLERIWQLFSDIDYEMVLTLTAARKGVM